MPNKTIYVREGDAELWAKAEEIAGGSVSGLLSEALSRYVEEEERKKEASMETLRVDLGGKTFGRQAEFVGEWLVSPGDEIRSSEPGRDLGAYYGIALTQRRKVAVYCAHVNDGFDAALEVYSSLDEAEEDGVPEDIIVAARSELDPNYVEKLDI
jgi:hypothetical protein